MTRLLLVPLDDAVVFPGMSVTLAVDTGDEERVLLVPRHNNEFASVGTVATVSEGVRLPGGLRAVVLEGLHRGIAGAAVNEPNGRLYVDVDERPRAQFHDPIEPVGELALVQRADQRRRPFACVAQQQVDDVAAERGVERGGGFVGEHE